MPYLNRFIATDNLIIHLTPFVNGLADNAIKANYAGFLSVSAVTVYELAIKDIFIEFANKKNVVFGKFIENHFYNINGKIKLSDLKGLHIQLFGDKYLKKFEQNLCARERTILLLQGKNVRSDYSNLVLCRHKYVHAGNPTLTFQEVLSNYEIGKEIIHSLHETMRR